MSLKGVKPVDKVYINVKKKLATETNKSILVKDLCEIYCSKPELIKAIEKIKIKKENENESWDYITSIEIVKKILEKYPNLDLDILGEPEILLEYKSQEDKKSFLEFIKITLVCIILFFGASLAIVNFHEDVNTRSSLSKLYYTFTGEKKDNPLLMAIPYSIGLGVGVITFFNRVFSFSKRRKMEPGPMEIELFLYDQDMEEQIFNEIKKSEEEEKR